MSVTLKSAIMRSILNYYVALKLSAGSVALVDWSLSDADPAPIVRRYIQPGETRWHPLELLMCDGKAAVVTVPIQSGAAAHYPAIRNN
jgi:hypothetical protein